MRISKVLRQAGAENPGRMKGEGSEEKMAKG